MRGKRLNWEAILKRIWRDGLGERGLDKIVEDMSPQEMQQIQRMQMMQAMSGAKGAKAGQPGQNPGYAADGAAVDNQTSQMMNAGA